MPQRSRASWTTASIGLALVCALCASWLALTIQRAEHQTSVHVAILSGMDEIQDAIRSRDRSHFEQNLAVLDSYLKDSEFAVQTGDLPAVARSGFDRMLALEAELKKPARPHEKIVEDLLRERDALQTRLVNT